MAINDTILQQYGERYRTLFVNGGLTKLQEQYNAAEDPGSDIALAVQELLADAGVLQRAQDGSYALNGKRIGKGTYFYNPGTDPAFKASGTANAFEALRQKLATENNTSYTPKNPPGAPDQELELAFRAGLSRQGLSDPQIDEAIRLFKSNAPLENITLAKLQGAAPAEPAATVVAPSGPRDYFNGDDQRASAAIVNSIYNSDSKKLEVNYIRIFNSLYTDKAIDTLNKQIFNADSSTHFSKLNIRNIRPGGYLQPLVYLVSKAQNISVETALSNLSNEIGKIQAEYNLGTTAKLDKATLAVLIAKSMKMDNLHVEKGIWAIADSTQPKSNACGLDFLMLKEDAMLRAGITKSDNETDPTIAKTDGGKGRPKKAENDPFARPSVIPVSHTSGDGYEAATYGKAVDAPADGVLKKGLGLEPKTYSKDVHDIQAALLKIDPAKYGALLQYIDKLGHVRKADGKFGERTEKAIIEFQKANGIEPANGEVNADLKKKILEQAAAAKEKDNKLVAKKENEKPGEKEPPKGEVKPGEKVTDDATRQQAVNARLDALYNKLLEMESTVKEEARQRQSALANLKAQNDAMEKSLADKVTQRLMGTLDGIYSGRQNAELTQAEFSTFFRQTGVRAGNGAVLELFERLDTDGSRILDPEEIRQELIKNPELRRTLTSLLVSAASVQEPRRPAETPPVAGREGDNGRQHNG